MSTWLPTTEAQRLIWLQNFALKLALYVGTAGVAAGDVTNANGWRDFYQWILNRSAQINTVKQDVNRWKLIYTNASIGTPLDALPVSPVYPIVVTPIGFTLSAGMWPQIFALAERIRNTAGYTPAIGEDLGIVGSSGGGELGDPVFQAIAQPNSETRLNWVKGSSEGVLIESQRVGEMTWTVMGTDRFSPYVDGRTPLVSGQPEVRRYRIRYLDGDDPVGNYSPVVTVTTTP